MESGQLSNSTPFCYMPKARTIFLVALALSLGFHAGLLALWAARALPYRSSTASVPLEASLTITPIQGMKPPSRASRATPARIEHRATGPLTHPAKPRAKPSIPPSPAPDNTPASMPAPPPPTAEEWKLASTYSLKNSKRYRYNWGQQVRSMMGTAVEGPEQGLVRFHIEIAPDGKLAKAEVLWSTSETAEKLALQAIRSLPPLPPTPTGKPLVFEKTIAFVPFETGWPPVYKNDCLPDPPSFHNPFAWDGSSTRSASREYPASASPSHGAAPQTECPDSEPDSIEAQEKDMERQFKEWGAGRLNGVE